MSESPLNNSRRERQIIEVLYRLGEASVAEVRSGLDDPPTYSTVRAMLSDLVQKNQLTFRQEGKRYLYRPKVAREKVANGLLKNLINNFFQARISLQYSHSLLKESRLRRFMFSDARWKRNECLA